MSFEKSKYFGVAMRGGRDWKKERDKIHGKAVLLLLRRGAGELLPFWNWISVDFGLILISVGLGLIGPWVWKAFVDYVAMNKPWPAWVNKWFGLLGATPGDRYSLLYATMGASLLLWVIGRAHGFFHTWWRGYMGQLFLRRLRGIVIDHYLKLSLRYHASLRVGDSMWRVLNDTGTLNQIYDNAFRAPWRDVIKVGSNLAIAIYLAPLLTFTVLGVVPFLILFSFVFIPRMRALARINREVGASFWSRTEGTLGAIRTVVAYNKEPEEVERFNELNWQAMQTGLNLTIWRQWMETAIGFTYMAGNIILTIIGGHMILQSESSATAFLLGDLLILRSYYANILDPVRQLIGIWAGLQSSLVGMDRVYTVLDTDLEVRNLNGARIAPPIADGLQFQNVSVSYDPDKRVLHNINLAARIGTVTALVGPVGCGKSTLVSCIPRLIDPVEGAVCFDGADIRGYTLESVRKQVSLAIQENTLFATSIRENILYGRPDALPQQFDEACRAACLNDFLTKLPEGLETHVGERASRLSGGERQRIAIARAFLRDSPILILDEPTAALDAETEARLVREIRRHARGRICFVIAHRLATVRQADIIHFMEEGRILESGSHAELMQKEGGRYRRFVEIQHGLIEGPENGGPVRHAADVVK